MQPQHRSPLSRGQVEKARRTGPCFRRDDLGESSKLQRPPQRTLFKPTVLV